ncbi:MAG TPA: hypothetical protein VMY39_01140, partial [Planctomycetota bacterium]|nr:hypothetical protein [Planctomycetota bacterium]
MFVSCDMSGFYRSEDGGQSWQLVDFRQTKSNTACPPVFHPTKPNVVYFAGKISEDAGKTWKPMVNPAPWRGQIQRMAVDPQQIGLNPVVRIIVVGLADGAWISTDDSKTWSACEGVKGSVIGIFVDPSHRRNSRSIVIGTSSGIYRSYDTGKTWHEKVNGLPWRDIRGFSGDTHGPMTAALTFRSVLYCTIASRGENGALAGGIYRSIDLGETWQSAMGAGLNTSLGRKDQWGSGEIPEYYRIAASGTRVYVFARGTGYWPPFNDTIYRSDDGGKTWQPIVFYDFRFTDKRAADYKGPREMNFVHGWIPYTITWIWGGLPGRSGLHVNERNADVVLAASGGELFVTTDGGKLWRQVYTKYAPGQQPPVPIPEERPGRWQSIGLEVTTTWNYRIDPHDHNRHFICYTDIGCIRSEDGGKTWTDSNKGTPWGNTTYDIVFDPARKGRVWAVMANVHDIPHWTYVHEEVKGPGGVCVSDDSGVTWKVSNTGLPDAPATSIALDPTSPVGSRTLYCAVYGHGVFKSTDDGKTWKAINNGIDLKLNSHSWLIKRHPSGALYLCVTATRGPGRGGNTYPQPGALYKSTDGGETWTNILAGINLYWPGEFAVHPTDTNTIYLVVHTATRRENGGVYRTTDGGKSWQRFLDNSSFRDKGGPNWATPLFITMDPDNPDTLYMGTDGHGLWISRDRAETWTQLEGLPFGNIHRVVFDPDDHGKVYITTFGAGVWVGPRP